MKRPCSAPPDTIPEPTALNTRIRTAHWRFNVNLSIIGGLVLQKSKSLAKAYLMCSATGDWIFPVLCTMPECHEQNTSKEILCKTATASLELSLGSFQRGSSNFGQLLSQNQEWFVSRIDKTLVCTALLLGRSLLGGASVKNFEYTHNPIPNREGLFKGEILNKFRVTLGLEMKQLLLKIAGTAYVKPVIYWVRGTETGFNVNEF